MPSGVEPIDLGEGFVAKAASLGIELDAGEVRDLGHYLALLLAANKTINLTAVKGTDEAVEKHLLDSLTLLPVLAEVGGDGDGESGDGGFVCSMSGAGAGFPGWCWRSAGGISG